MWLPICWDILYGWESILARTPRELAYRTLLNAEQDHSKSIDEILSDQLAHSSLSTQEKAWVMELVYGATRMKLQLDAWIKSAFKGRYRKAQHALKVLLRMGVFQLKYMQTAEHAAIHETVDLARKSGQQRASGLVNAVLRQIQSLDLKQILDPVRDQDKRLAIETSHPEWLIARWLSQYDRDEVIALCTHNNSSPKTWIRRNIQQVNEPEFEAYLATLKIPCQRSDLLNSFYEVGSAATLLKTQEFHKGWFSFQDLAAGLVASLLDPQPGETVVDACAAPGGKMALLAEQSAGNVSIFACDASSSRLKKLQQTVDRLKLQHINITRLDATVDSLPESNKILLDVPCSGTGVLNRRPDARWRRQAEDLHSLTEIQHRILINSWKSLLPGGIMVYATCSIESEENWDLIDSVMEHLENGEIAVINEEKLKPYIDERGALATLPWRHGMDGMFAVKIRKAL